MPLYADVKELYEEALLKEHVATKASKATLRAEAAARAPAAASEVVRRREEAERAIEALRAESEAEVERLEEERRRRLAEHRERLRELEVRAEARRTEAEAKLRVLEEETLGAFSGADAEVQRIAAERDLAVRSIAERGAQSLARGEERIRTAERFELDETARGRASTKHIEEQGLWTAREAEARCKAMCEHHASEVQDLQRRVSAQVESILSQARGTHASLLVNRDRADEHLGLELQRRKDETAKIVDSAEEALEEARRGVRAANDQADDAALEAKQTCEALRRDQLSAAAAAGEGLSNFVHAIPWREKMDRPTFVQALEELAHQLRNGTFLQPTPKVHLAAEHHVAPPPPPPPPPPHS